MNTKTRNRIIITVGILSMLFFYGKHNFHSDRQIIRKIIITASTGDVNSALIGLEKAKNISNPIVLGFTYYWKNKMYSRFVTKEEVLENTSGNKIIYDISNIYREYWRTQLLKDSSEIKTDSFLYENLSKYMLSNNLTQLSKDSLDKTIKDDTELSKIIMQEGYQSKFRYRNGFQELQIWDDETIEHYTVTLPKDTIDATVVFINSFHLNGYDDYATFGDATVGGWAIKDSATLYCNGGSYNLSSENFKISYLKHESIHFTDLNEYPNLSGADLEYRAKLIELMYLSKSTIYNRIGEFLSGASSTDRSYTHPYAEHCIIRDFSQLLFDSEYQDDYKKWQEVSVEKLNETATQLYNMSEEKLSIDKNASEII